MSDQGWTGPRGWLGGCALLLSAWLVSGPVGATPVASVTPAHLAPANTQRLTADARHMLAWIMASGDHGGRPFMVVDKRQAQVFVFNGRGRMLGAAPALLGMAVGDVDVPGVGLKPVAQIAPSERITPAGRFETEPGQGLQGDALVWLDYAAGLAIHRVRPGAAQSAREQRLAGQLASMQRVSLGCVVLSAAFLDEVVMPALGRQPGVVYVLPETRPVKAWLQQSQLDALARF